MNGKEMEMNDQKLQNSQKRKIEYKRNRQKQKNNKKKSPPRLQHLEAFWVKSSSLTRGVDLSIEKGFFFPNLKIGVRVGPKTFEYLTLS